MKNDTFVKIQWWDFVVSGFCFLMWGPGCTDKSIFVNLTLL